MSAKRILVHASIFDEFASRLTAKTDGLRLGPPLDATTQIGPLASAAALAKVAAQVEAGLAAGAVALAGGGRPSAARCALTRELLRLKAEARDDDELYCREARRPQAWTKDKVTVRELCAAGQLAWREPLPVPAPTLPPPAPVKNNIARLVNDFRSGGGTRGKGGGKGGDSRGRGKPAAVKV